LTYRAGVVVVAASLLLAAPSFLEDNDDDDVDLAGVRIGVLGALLPLLLLLPPTLPLAEEEDDFLAEEEGTGVRFFVGRLALAIGVLVDA
jgi:hypothetical protein